MRNSAGPLSAICLSVATDTFKTLRNRCLRQEEEKEELSQQERHLQLANGILTLFNGLQKLEHDVFRGSETLTALLLEWIATTQAELTAVEQTLATVGELLKDLAQEEMQDCMVSFLEDVGPLIILLTRNPQLRQLVETQIVTEFDAMT